MSKKVSTIQVLEDSAKALPRRKFLTYAGLSASAVIFASSCSKESLQTDNAYAIRSEGGGRDGGKAVVNLGSGDTGILNYAYALEQLEAAFYIQVMTTPFGGMTSKETEYLTDIRDHEIAHREFFKNVLGNNRIGGIIVDFSNIDFSSRASVLGTAKAFEDLGVSAYNGAGELLQSATYLLFAGKIVSVEARHAAAIRDMISYGSFADSTAVDMNGLDLYRTPPEVLAIAGNYIQTRILAQNLPTS
ncbi:MAG: ferritin-like domain-containing protein [Ferruginibacter sp.]